MTRQTTPCIPTPIALPRSARRIRHCILAVLLSLGFAACSTSSQPSGSMSGDNTDAAGASGMPTATDAAGMGGTDAAPDPSLFATPSMCSSEEQWTRGNRESPLMHPGGACIGCHSRGEGPSFSLAGTVYPTAHEPDDCNGVEGANDVHIVITDANGDTLMLSVNAAGNFFSSTRIALPFHAKVVTLGQERAMAAAQMTGDCNSCHTESGQNGAPGRIMLP